MPGNQKIVKITWDGYGWANVEEIISISKYNEKEVVDMIGRNPSTFNFGWTETNDSLLFISQDHLNEAVEELKRAHRLLHENSQSSNQLVVARREAENSASQNYALQARNSNLQTENNSLQIQLADKERQIQWGVGQLAQVQNQLATIRGESTQKQARIDTLTQQFNALQIESNNKNNEINNLREELDGSRNIDLRYREKKLDELVRNSGLNRGRIDNLRAAYERLKHASDRANYNQEGVTTAQNEIDTIKRELFQANVSVDDLHRIYRVCEKVAELRVNLQQQPQFEAHTQVPPPRNY